MKEVLWTMPTEPTDGQPPARSATDKAPEASSAHLADLIVAIAQTKDRAAFAEIFAHFAPRVKGYLLRLGASKGHAE
jgi:RNA polymerase sigma-70 factor (ECF subfamily)